jgi:hypothetical protein
MAAAVVALFTTAFAASPEFRAGTLNVLMAMDEKVATLQFGDRSDFLENSISALDDTVKIDLGYVPSSYTVTETKQSRVKTDIRYTNDMGDQISISVFSDTEMVLNFDLEDADYIREVVVQGHSAIIVEKEGLTRIIWVDEDADVFVEIEATALEQDDLMAVANSINLEN